MEINTNKYHAKEQMDKNNWVDLMVKNLVSSCEDLIKCGLDKKSAYDLAVSNSCAGFVIREKVIKILGIGG